MTKRGEVLVAILNRPRDAELAHKEHWYRIPIESQMKWITHGWPPKWIAFYHTKAIGEEAHAIHFYAEVTEIQQMRRKELLPKDRYDKKAERLYHKLTLGSMQRLERPIPSPRLR